MHQMADPYRDQSQILIIYDYYEYYEMVSFILRSDILSQAYAFAFSPVRKRTFRKEVEYLISVNRVEWTPQAK